MRLAMLLFTEKMCFMHLCSTYWMPTANSHPFKPVKAMGWSGHTFMTEPGHRFMSGKNSNSKSGCLWHLSFYRYITNEN